MPAVGYCVGFAFMRALDEEYQRFCKQSNDCAPRNGDLSVGGGDWMDNFFKAEAIRGALTVLRHGGSLKEAVADGKALAEIAVQIWNGRREYQVRRWDGWIESFLQETMERVRRKKT